MCDLDHDDHRDDEMIMIDDDGVGVDDEVEHLLGAVAGPPLLSTSLHHILNTEV